MITPLPLPRSCMTGALAAYISDPQVEDFQPMGCNMGLLPSPETHIKDKRLRYETVAHKAIESLTAVLKDCGEA